MKARLRFSTALAVGFIARLAVFAPTAFAAPGDLDTSFNGTGKVITPIGSGQDYGRSVAVQSDGKIVMAGFIDTGTSYEFALARFTSAGALDASFGSGGMVTTPIGLDADARSVALQSDGKILVAGTSWNGSKYNIALARYTDAGRWTPVSAAAARDHFHRQHR